jgi:hypothetical protein
MRESEEGLESARCPLLSSGSSASNVGLNQILLHLPGQEADAGSAVKGR